MKGLGLVDILLWIISIPLEFLRSLFQFTVRGKRK